MKIEPPIDLRCYMVAIGEAHQQMAEWTVPLVEKHTQLSVEVVTEGDPFEMKLKLFERHQGHILFIDVDAVVRSWDWAPFDFSVFNASKDYRVNGAWMQSLEPFFPLDRCVNSGVWLAAPQHQTTFQLAQTIACTELRDHEFKLGDQSPLNAALWRKKISVNWLPLEMNYTVSPKEQENGLPNIPENVHVVHIIGNTVGTCKEANHGRKLQRVREAVDLTRRIDNRSEL